MHLFHCHDIIYLGELRAPQCDGAINFFYFRILYCLVMPEMFLYVEIVDIQEEKKLRYLSDTFIITYLVSFYGDYEQV